MSFEFEKYKLEGDLLIFVAKNNEQFQQIFQNTVTLMGNEREFFKAYPSYINGVPENEMAIFLTSHGGLAPDPETIDYDETNGTLSFGTIRLSGDLGVITAFMLSVPLRNSIAIEYLTDRIAPIETTLFSEASGTHRISTEEPDARGVRQKIVRKIDPNGTEPS